MDSLSQIVLGAACGEAVLGKKIQNKALLWGAVGGTIPDMDVFISPFFDSVDALFVHRGFSHSLTFPFLAAPLLGFLLSMIYRKTGVSWKEWSMLFWWSIITHPLLDSFTGFGTGLFEPFSNYRVDISSIFIIDPLYTLPFLLCLILVLRAKKDSGKRKKWNTIGIIISAFYLFFTYANQQVMKAGFEKELKRQGILINRIMTIPSPFNTILWGTAAETERGYYVGYRSWFDKKGTHFTFFPKNDSLISAYLNNAKIKKLIRFSKGYYCISELDGKLFFNDMRFGQTGGWSDSQADFVFSFPILKNTDGDIDIQRGEWRSSRMSGLATLWKRIRGI